MYDGWGKVGGGGGGVDYLLRVKGEKRPACRVHWGRGKCRREAVGGGGVEREQ